MFKKILVPIEFGENATSVAAFARKLASPDGAIRHLHVLPDELTLSLSALADRDEILAEASAQLAALAGEGASFDSQIREGTPHREILAEAESFGADAIVLGSHGRRGLPRLLLGSVAERVLRGSQGPVCIVKGEVDATTPLQRIALATDFESSGDTAKAVFGDLVHGSGCEGTVVHSFRRSRALTGSEVPMPYEAACWGVTIPAREYDSHVQTLRNTCDTQVESLAASLRENGEKVQPLVLEGEPWTELAQLAEARKLDLLILGTHHYSTFERLTLGSVAEKTLRTVQCPVLVVPRREAQSAEA